MSSSGRYAVCCTTHAAAVSESMRTSDPSRLARLLGTLRFHFHIGLLNCRTLECTQCSAAHVSMVPVGPGFHPVSTRSIEHGRCATKKINFSCHRHILCPVAMSSYQPDVFPSSSLRPTLPPSVSSLSPTQCMMLLCNHEMAEATRRDILDRCRLRGKPGREGDRQAGREAGRQAGS